MAPSLLPLEMRLTQHVQGGGYGDDEEDDDEDDDDVAAQYEIEDQDEDEDSEEEDEDVCCDIQTPLDPILEFQSALS